MSGVLDRLRRAPKSKASTPDFAPRLSYFALEQRTVFAAAAAALADDASKHADAPAPDAPPAANASHYVSHGDLAACLSQAPIPDNAKSVAFVDVTAGNNPSVFGRVPPGADIVLLDPKREAAQQITDYLSQRSDKPVVLLVSAAGVQDLSAADTQQDSNGLGVAQVQQQQT